MEAVKQNIIHDGFFPFKVIYSTEPERMHAHWHSQIEFMFFYETDGCVYRCKDKKIDVCKHDLIIANSAEVHECTDFKNSSVCCIIADVKMLGQYRGIIFKNLVRNDERIAEIFGEMYSAKNTKTHDLVCASCIYKLILILTEDYISSYAVSGKCGECLPARKTTQEVLRFIENNLSEDLSIKRLACVSHMSAGRLAHIFKEITGVSPGEYIEKTRIAGAAQMLRETDAGISDIAYKCGFSGHSYFSARFKKYMGLSPCSYRKKFECCKKVD